MKTTSGRLFNSTSTSDMDFFPEKMPILGDFYNSRWKTPKMAILTKKVPQEPGGAHTS